MSQKAQNQDTGSLQDFKFDDETSFFGIGATSTSTEVNEELLNDIQDNDDDPPIEKGKGKKKETVKNESDDNNDSDNEEDDDDNEEDKITFFGEDEEDDKGKGKKSEEELGTGEDDETPNEDKTKKKKPEAKGKVEEGKGEDDKFFTVLAKEMGEKGIFQNIEVKDDEILTEDQFFELQEKEIEARVDETFQAFFEELDEDAKQFLKFKKDGGKTSDFFHIINNRGLDIEEFDVENEQQRIKVIKNYLTTVEKLDAEEVEDKLEWLKEGGKEKVYATKYFEKIKSNREALKKAALKAQEEAIAEKESAAKEFNDSLNEVLSKTNAVGAFTINKNDQKELGNYITKPSVKVGKNRYIPEFQAKISEIFKADNEDSKKKLLLLAKLVKSNFDVTDLVKDTKTKVTKEVKSKLQEAKESVKVKSVRDHGAKSLGDYF